MGIRPPGPLCSERLGSDWIDGGTLCRNRSVPPGPIMALGALAKSKDPKKAVFDREHVYSLALEAAIKRDIDMEIIGDDYGRSAEISLTSERYLKELIRLGSAGQQAVSDRAKKLQFFIVRGGAEGFLTPDMAHKDASNVVFPGSTTNGKKSSEFRFDNNDLMAVFDPNGKLIRAALLQRPTLITGGVWSTKTANDVYNAWHNKAVSIYRNTSFDVPYLGLVIDDGMKKRAWVDLHKQEATNGCIFIVDEDTPEYGKDELHAFEPKLIIESLAAIGMKPEQVKGRVTLGVMKVVDIK